MNAGEAILNEALKDVKLNMNARTFEGTSILLKTIVDSGKELLNIHEKLKKIKKIETPKPKADVEKEGEAGSIKGKMSDILDTMDEIDNEDKDHASERDGRTS
jgi:hypothetical protein